MSSEVVLAELKVELTQVRAELKAIRDELAAVIDAVKTGHDVQMRELAKLNEARAVIAVVDKKSSKPKGEKSSKATGVRFQTKNVWFAGKFAIDADCIKPLIAKYPNELVLATSEVDANPGKKKKTDQERRKAIGTKFYKKIDDAGEFKEGTQLFSIFATEKNEYTKKKETEVKPPDVANILPPSFATTSLMQPPILPLGLAAPLSIGAGAVNLSGPLFST